MTLNGESYKLNSFENLSSKVQFWKIDLPENLLNIEEEDSEDLDLLCELVRNQYLKRLRQTLLDNLNITRGYQKTDLYHVQKCVDICLAEMEKQALRRCMVASIYRESMFNMINEVKTNTKNSMLYILLKHIIESNNKSSLWNKYNEPEIMAKESTSIFIDQKVNKSISTQTETYADLDSNLSFNIVVNNTEFMKTSNISSSSTSKELKNSEQKNCATNDILSINTLLRDLQDSPKYEQQYSKLEERLITLGLANENQEPTENFSELAARNYISSNTIRENIINKILENKFKSDRVAKSYELRKSINELPWELKERLNQKFDDLFGNGHTYESDPLSEKEERIIAHKRIVKMVVKFMTPYYKANRINRYLFKSLAKLISKNLMDRTYDQDETSVARGVSEYFTGNRCIKTFKDIYE